MSEDEEGARATLRVFAIAAIALLGLAFSATPIAERLDAALLDAQWTLLRKFDPRHAPDDIIVVGIDEKSLRSSTEPIALWHEPLAKALARIAAAKPRAIGLAAPLPERSFESVRPGLDRMLLTSLLAARQNGPFVAVIDIDARTRGARPIHPPYLAVLNDERLSLGILSRDVDGVTRRFSLQVPTEDGGFATLAGRLCRALSKTCAEGLIHYALGPPHRFVPLSQVADSADPQLLDRLFRDRIVMIGETQRYSDRLEVPVNLAGWETERRTSPAVVVHAQALRTALSGAAPVEAARPFTLVLVTLAALLWLMRRAALSLAAGLLVAAATVVAATLLLRGGVYLPISAGLATLTLAWALRAAMEVAAERRRREQVRTTFQGRVSAVTQRDILRGHVKIAGEAERRDIACVAVGLRSPESVQGDPPAEVLAARGRLHRVIADAVLGNDGMLERMSADEWLAAFGALRRHEHPSRQAAAAVKEMLRGIERLDADLAKHGRPGVAAVVAATFGEAVVGRVTPDGPLRHAVTGPVVEEALRLRDEARRSGPPFAFSDAFRSRAGDDLSDFQHPG